jgi:hypothetical protein
MKSAAWKGLLPRNMSEHDMHGSELLATQLTSTLGLQASTHNINNNIRSLNDKVAYIQCITHGTIFSRVYVRIYNTH